MGELGCEYCTIDSTSRKVLGYDGSGDGISVVYGDGVVGIDSDTWEFVINFCPNCGKPLTEEAVRRSTPWVKCGEKMPTKDDWYWVTDMQFIERRYYNPKVINMWRSEGLVETAKISHWMPYTEPAPPKED